jgi:hypothetical protein
MMDETEVLGEVFPKGVSFFSPDLDPSLRFLTFDALVLNLFRLSSRFLLTQFTG